MHAARDARLHPTAGVRRLLEHGATLNRVTAADRLTARTRLESELGSELAGRLLGALSRRGGNRPLALV